jgi:hydroxyacylglutathione hydrolase
MRKIADGLYELDACANLGFPEQQCNQWLVGSVVVDAGVRFFADAILKELADCEVTAHAITHGHMDHQGSSHAICEALQIPLWCPADEAANVESGDLLPLVPDSELTRQQIAEMAGPGHPVARRLREGDELAAGFVVVDTPGHSPGHVSYWREADRILIVGDAIASRDAETGELGLIEPRNVFTVDPARNRESIRRIAALRPKLLLFGHGPASSNRDELERFAARLPRELEVG